MVADEDDEADAVFRELYEKYPRGSYAERAAWKAGWRAYRQERPADTVRFFERAAAEFPRSDYRPAWLYWAGRAHDSAERAGAGRRALHADGRRLHELVLRASGAETARGPQAAAAHPRGTDLGSCRRLRTSRSSKRCSRSIGTTKRSTSSGTRSGHGATAPAVQATISYVYRRKGMAESNTTERFNLLRGSITLMRRAYPQFMAAGGQELPRDIQVHIFPMAYWDLISKYSAQNNLDPYLIAALMAQESTFVPGIRSHANAYGLMQLVAVDRAADGAQAEDPVLNAPADEPRGQRPDGDRPFRRLIRDFGGGVHLALASYNAGESAVRRWIAERPGLADREEFIDDIPYPETQNYVKRILGTAEDYRRLYAGS